MGTRATCLCAAVFIFCTAMGSGQAPPFGGEFQVNTYTTGDQDFPAVAVGTDGTFVIAWQSYGQDGSVNGVFAQPYGADGVKVGPELQLNVTTTGQQSRPAVAATKDGYFVVAWESDGQDGYGYGIFARTIVHNVPVQIQDLQVNTYTTGGQYSPAVASTETGFVIVWSTESQDKAGIFGQMFTPGGVSIGSEFQVDTGTSRAFDPSIAMDASGNFVVVWVGYVDGSGRGVAGQRFDASGAKVGSVFPVNTYTTGDQEGPRVAMGKHGDFVVVWSDYQGEDGDSAGVFGQRFNASAEKVGPEFQVNSYTTYGQDFPSVGMDSRGGFFVTWATAGNVPGQLFDRTGARIGSQFAISTSMSPLHGDQQIASGADTFVATWGIGNDDGAGEGVFRSRTNPIPEPMRVDTHGSAQATGDLNGVLEPGESVRVEPAWKNVGGNAFARTGTASNFTGPGGAALYHLPNSAADYGSIPAGATANCFDATANCYRVTLDVPAARPATHWDAAFQEDLSPNGTKLWTLHVGDSFSDVPRSQPFYAKIETLLHYGITSGCGPTTYCPGSVLPRDQMAIFVAKGIAGTGELVPTTGFVGGQAYHCAPGGHSLFSDVSPTDAACKHIHYLAAQNVTLGCNTGQFCPSQTITRDAMAAFIAKGIVAPQGGAGIPLADAIPSVGSYNCDPSPPNHSNFTDVPPSSPFCKHVNYLWLRGIVAGCGGTLYCPTGTVSRDAMAKFIANGFALQLYGP